MQSYARNRGDIPYYVLKNSFLTHICLVEPSILMTSPFVILGMSGVPFRFLIYFE